jgi:hypothetical protein
MEIDYTALFALLTAYRADRVVNQYAQDVQDLDRQEGSAIRLHNLHCYLEAFAGANYLLVGEAAGYAGCRFSGIPFTCEAQLVGPEPLDWAQDSQLARSSRADTLWAERSATMVWAALGQRADCLLWNAFPWHPHQEGDLLTNRRPGVELRDGLPVLDVLVSELPSAKVVAVGRVAQRALGELGLDAPYVRHPSHGGKRAFEAGIAALPVVRRTPST